jgi:3-phenylpropionate/cinnamic acid dioxygenase small subunit
MGVEQISDTRIARRLMALEARASIEDRLYEYSHAIDVADEERWIDCFTKDGVFDVRGRLPGQTTLVVRGHEELREFVRRHSRPPLMYHRHLLLQPCITIANGKATATGYTMVLMEHEGEPVVRLFGTARDALVHESDGAWRFETRTVVIESMKAGLPALSFAR